ncbi:LLM class flavin-dependent oxidoreductase [Streptomyces sp. BK205]|uniref:LLM class flavin-dependent oxidoreductase n=1 Tax=Streptomyces sp. BK205 TaxID=2512164 RepID=UPI0010443F39|nr:LLM class flavin-dependent oxidoreductase [Streptomyces sp. BK205]TCR17366.1 luciferase-like monooxygenase [Streptomyces sp. BK205]
MKLQVVLPDETAGADPRRLVDLARRAEDLGYDTAWLPDHVLPPDEYGPVYGGVFEPLVTLGWLAGADLLEAPGKLLHGHADFADSRDEFEAHMSR